MSNLVFCIMGPTASGKTALACQLVQKYPFEIISVDSAMIYRGMNIGTAKPKAEELEQAPHYLIDIKDPNELYSAAEFCSQATALCLDIIQRGKIPLLAGGTMMYFHALQQGLSSLPEADPIIRARIEKEAQIQGWDHMHQKLGAVDPKTAARIHTHDKQRIERALEVYYSSGLPLSQLIEQQKQPSNYRFINIVLMPEPRAWLHQRIEQRFDEMLQIGLVEEVSQLKSQWNLDNTMPSMRCLGYRQVLDYLDGDYDYATMREKGIAATRQFAKRQLTWLRSWDNALVYNPAENSSFHDEIIAKIGEILDNDTSYL